MSRVLYTSDLHLGHQKVAEYRGFASTDEHDAAVIQSWHEHATDADIVYVLGDLTMGRSREVEERALDILASMPGRKRLIPGNHDSVHPLSSASLDRDWMLRWYAVFESIQPLAVRKVGKQRLMLCHLPYDEDGGDHTDQNRHREWRPHDIGLPLVHGHTHLRDQRLHGGRQVHVGWDAWRRPVSESEVLDLVHSSTLAHAH